MDKSALPRTDRAGPLFVYGTLQFPEVLQAVLLRVPRLDPAQAPGHRVVRLDGRIYPGLVKAAGSARGFLIGDLTAAEWRILDEFEGDEYDVLPVGVVHRDGAPAGAGGSRPAGRPQVRQGARGALTYACRASAGPMDADWSAEHFARTHLPAYAEECAAWRRLLGEQAPGTR